MALGINETAGYLGVAVTALATGYLATGFGLRPAPDCSAPATPSPGWPCPSLAVRDTAAWAAAEARQHPRHDGPRRLEPRHSRAACPGRTAPSPAVSQAGLVNNLNDGLVWVILPVLLVDHGVSVTGVGYVKGVLPVHVGRRESPPATSPTGSAASRRSSPGCSSRPPAWP